MNKNPKGSVAVIVLVIVIIAIVALGIWYYYGAHQSAMTPSSATINNTVDTSSGASNEAASYTTQTVGTTTIVTVTDLAFANAGWIPNLGPIFASSTFSVGNTVYQLKELSSSCDKSMNDFGSQCDESLVATANGTTTVLVPSLLTTINPNMASVIYLIGATDEKIYIGVVFDHNEGSTLTRIYSFAFKTKQFAQLSYVPGECYQFSPSSAYVMDYQDGSTTPMQSSYPYEDKDEVLSQKVEVFSLIDDAVVYTQNLTAPAIVQDGGMDCSPFYRKLNTSSTFYNIINQFDYTPISTVEVNLP